jgi:hypothetical protein
MQAVHLGLRGGVTTPPIERSLRNGEILGDLIDEAPGPTWHLLGRSKSLRDPRAKDPRIDPRGPVKRLKARWKRDGREIWQAAELRKRRREELQTVINALDDEDRRWLADELMSYSSWLAP